MRSAVWQEVVSYKQHWYIFSNHLYFKLKFLHINEQNITLQGKCTFKIYIFVSYFFTEHAPLVYHCSFFSVVAVSKM